MVRYLIINKRGGKAEVVRYLILNKRGETEVVRYLILNKRGGNRGGEVFNNK